MAIKKLCPFKLWTLQNFPFIAEDFDALTNYELMCKIIEYLNNVITITNEQTKAINDMKEYFDNLDVQDEVDKKLDEMAEDGTLSQIIAEYLNKSVLVCNDIADLITKDLIEGVVIKSLNKENNDNLTAYYKIVASDYTDETNDYITLNNGLKAIKLPFLDNINEVEVHFPYRGQNMGDCIVIKGSKNIIIDLGIEDGLSYLISYLINNNITKIDYLIITHNHVDHIGGNNGVQTIVANEYLDFSTCKFILNNPIDWTQFIGSDEIKEGYQSREAQIVAIGEDLGGVIYPNANTKIYLDRENYLSFYNTTYVSTYYQNLNDEGVTDLNDFSLVCMLTHLDKKFLFTGDIEGEAEEHIKNDIYNVDVLKVMHHGVNTDDKITFINNVNPIYSVIMNGQDTRAIGYYTLASRIETKLYTSNESQNVIFKTNQKEIEVYSTNGELHYNMGELIHDGDDLNDYIYEGEYRSAIYGSDPYTIANCPLSRGKFSLIVKRIDSLSGTFQFLLQATNSQEPNLTWVRSHNGSTIQWTPWRKLQIEKGYIKAHLSTAWTSPADIDSHVIPFDTAGINSGTDFTFDATNHTIICNRAGTIKVNVQILLTGVTANSRNTLYLYKNTGIQGSSETEINGTRYQVSIPNCYINVSAGDTISLQLKNGSGNSVTINAIGNRNYFEAEYINS